MCGCNATPGHNRSTCDCSCHARVHRAWETGIVATETAAEERKTLVSHVHAAREALAKLRALLDRHEERIVPVIVPRPVDPEGGDRDEYRVDSSPLGSDLVQLVAEIQRLQRRVADMTEAVDL